MDDITPSKIVRNVDTPESRSAFDPRQVPSGGLDADVSHYNLFNFFSLDPVERADRKVNDKVKFINEWATRKVNSRNVEDIIRQLTHTELKLHQPQLGVSRLDTLYRYVKIESQIDDLMRQRDQLNGGRNA